MIDELTNDISNDNTLSEKDKEIKLKEEKAKLAKIEAKQTICNNTGISIMTPFLKYDMTDEEINFHDFLFSNLEDNKKEFANFFCESILNDYKDFDFTNVKKFDSIDFINDDLNIMELRYIQIINLCNTSYFFSQDYILFLLYLVIILYTFYKTLILTQLLFFNKSIKKYVILFIIGV